MKVNPKTLIWTAPSETAGGDPIAEDRELEYEVGSVDESNGSIEPIMVVASQLRDADQYEAPISDLQFDNGEYSLVLRTFYKDKPNLKSKWSNAVEFRINDEVPKRPLDFSVV